MVEKKRTKKRNYFTVNKALERDLFFFSFAFWKMPRTFVLASRASELAQIQTNIVLSKLKEKYPEAKFGTKFMSTGGDKNQTQALYLLGGKALWTKELEEALIEGEVDMVVHSLKDVPTKMPFGCVIGGVLDREDPVDSLVVRKGERWMKMEDMPDGSVIGTSSVRRVAQLRRMYPNVKFLDIVSFSFCFFGMI